ncbi:hypothetical protein K2Z83_28485 [Oscillochloris sp. ZM17-4]|uniref:hypothetical protein n=1 Tax=Oscillochloris sp. ZM17-4 TaxID=2866714 RepID=UPI001C72EA04|nr:hypothetical protein [Oscillochloris sp. ZM17-4]MBX0331594.1 hypothetical protein [Oscillochloris sp. ZM17-4]
MTNPPVLSPPTPAALRAELERLVILDLLGPAGGPEEEIAEGGVRDRYLVGMLAPRQQQVAPEEQDDIDPAGEDAPDDGPIDRGATQAPSMFPSSFGLTFTVDGDVPTLISEIWYRIVGDSGQRHLVSPYGSLLLDEGLV